MMHSVFVAKYQHSGIEHGGSGAVYQDFSIPYGDFGIAHEIPGIKYRCFIALPLYITTDRA